MTDSGQIERVALARKKSLGKTSLLQVVPFLDSAEHYEREGYEVETFIPESDHYSEIERLAGELEARASDIHREPRGTDEGYYRGQGFAAGLTAAASLLRDSVPPDSQEEGSEGGTG